MAKAKVYNYSVRTKDEKLNEWIQNKIRERDCSICTFIKEIIIRDYKKDKDKENEK